MRRLHALGLALIVVSVAAADVPLPPDLRYVKPRVRFLGVENYPEQAFFLKFRTANGNPFAAPPVHVEVKNAEPFTLLTARRITGVELFALPAREAKKRRAEDSSLKWLDPKTPGLLSAGVKAPPTVTSRKDSEVPVTTYKVTIKDGKLIVESPTVEKKSEAPGIDRTRTLVAGLAFAVGLALLGLWFARKNR
jgi:hypothetical protein